MINNEGMSRAIAKFPDFKVLVIGDIIADVYTEGLISRISREAPVLILEQQQDERIVPGGAANTARNLATMGGDIFLSGVIGVDPIGDKLVGLLRAVNIHPELIYRDKTYFTCTKTRILASASHAVKQQVLRIDRLPKTKLAAEFYHSYLERLEEALPSYDGVIVSDYGMPFLSGKFRGEVLSLIAKTQKPVLVDSRYSLSKYQGATIVTPNLEEASGFVGYALENLEALEKAGREILAALGSEAVLITRGPDGMSLFLRNGETHHIPVFNKVDIADVSGAGDTVASVLFLGILAGLDYLTAANLANIAASVVVRKVGTSTVTQTELQNAIEKMNCRQLQ